MKQTISILRSPINRWEKRLKSTKASLQDVEAELGALVQRAALLHAYISHRYNTGCGDQGHKDSAAVANRTLLRVRKVMGYTYPKQLPVRIA